MCYKQKNRQATKNNVGIRVILRGCSTLFFISRFDGLLIFIYQSKNQETDLFFIQRPISGKQSSSLIGTTHTQPEHGVLQNSVYQHRPTVPRDWQIVNHLREIFILFLETTQLSLILPANSSSSLNLGYNCYRIEPKRLVWSRHCPILSMSHQIPPRQ